MHVKLNILRQSLAKCSGEVVNKYTISLSSLQILIT